MTNAAYLTKDLASSFAQLALSGINREFPAISVNVLTLEQDLKTPKSLHPAFYGCFDWHSSVHTHWLLIRLLKIYPDLNEAVEIKKAINRNLTPANLLIEKNYFENNENRSFERMYGWAWFLTLSAEIKSSKEPNALEWYDAIKPFEACIVKLTEDYLKKLTYPIRCGFHPNTAFALTLMLDYSREVKNAVFEDLVISRGIQYFSGDKNYPIEYEPSGEDFLSPGLCVADLMRRLLNKELFLQWFNTYLPTLADSNLGKWKTPVHIVDITDGRLGHLVGLNFNRAWTLKGILSALPANDARITPLKEAYNQHVTAAIPYVISGHYTGEHWLGTFATYCLS